MIQEGRVVSVNIGSKGLKKRPISFGELTPNFGLVGDGHGGHLSRQVSLLALESIEKIKGLGFEVSFGDFAENITTSGLNLTLLRIGDKIRIGEKIVLRVTQIGKICHRRCAIFYQVGDCIMPKEGIFAEVLCGGKIQSGDRIVVGEE